MKLLYIIFCDDIRQEINNKFSLIGLYNDRIVFINKKSEITWPQPINLSVFLRFSVDKNKELPDAFEFEYHLNKTPIVKINGQLNIDIKNESQFQLAINRVYIPLEPGYLGFSIKLYSHKKILFSEVKEAALVIAGNE